MSSYFSPGHQQLGTSASMPSSYVQQQVPLSSTKSPTANLPSLLGAGLQVCVFEESHIEKDQAQGATAMARTLVRAYALRVAQ